MNSTDPSTSDPYAGWLTSKEAAEALGIGYAYLRKLARQGRLDPYVVKVRRPKEAPRWLYNPIITDPEQWRKLMPMGCFSENNRPQYRYVKDGVEWLSPLDVARKLGIPRAVVSLACYRGLLGEHAVCLGRRNNRRRRFIWRIDPAVTDRIKWRELVPTDTIKLHQPRAEYVIDGEIWLSSEEAARRIQTNPVIIRRSCREGLVTPYCRKVKNRWLIHESIADRKTWFELTKGWWRTHLPPKANESTNEPE